MLYNYRLDISYDGSRFHGFQKQNNCRTIQGELEKAITRLNSQIPVKVLASGRTDAKVHALNQVCMFTSEKEFKPSQFLIMINRLLPDDIYVKSIAKVAEDFHPRYNSRAKKYIYYINQGEYDVFNKNYCLQLNKKLDIVQMKKAAQFFIGAKDFRTFSSATKEKNTIKEMYAIDISEENNIVKIEFYGTGFLRYMVRKITMILIEAGLNKVDDHRIIEYLNAKDISKYSKIAGGEGLYLKEVIY